MMMTAAGTISPTKLFVMGVGVAGLQAIATGRRLGAQVSATDVRSATREQIQSLGAKPIFVENVAGIEGEGAGGYAGEMSDEYKVAQAELVSAHIAKQDIVITTRADPGPPGAAADQQCAAGVDAAGQRGGRSRGGCRRQCRGLRPGRDSGRAWRDDHRRAQLSGGIGSGQLGAILAQSLQFSHRPSGTRKPAAPRSPTTTRSSRLSA